MGYSLLKQLDAQHSMEQKVWKKVKETSGELLIKKSSNQLLRNAESASTCQH